MHIYTHAHILTYMHIYQSDLPENADGVDTDAEGDGYECCWKAPNDKLARYMCVCVYTLHAYDGTHVCINMYVCRH